MLDRSKAQLISHLPPVNYPLPSFQFCQYFIIFPITKLKILDGFLTVPSSSSSLKIHTHFLEILSSECSRTCLNCYVLGATLLVHDPVAPCLDYGNRLLVSSLSVCSNCYFHDATLLRVLNDFLKVWSGPDSH